MRRMVVIGVVGLVAVAINGCPKTPGTEAGSSSSSSGGQSVTDAGNADAAVAIPDASVDRDAAPPPDSGCPAHQMLDGHGQCHTVCSSPSDCGPQETCNTTLGLCVAVPVVACDPNSCPAGFVCPRPDAGMRDGGGSTCVPGPGYCSVDGDCSIIERCDTNHCVSRAGDIVRTCGADAGCPLLTNCTFGVCVGCVTDLQCSIGHPGARCLVGTCVTTGALGPGGACIGKTCPMGQHCSLTTGLCETTCHQNAECGDAGRICAPVINQCVTDFGCTEDGGCAPGLTCAGVGIGGSTGVCTGCDSTTPCSPGLRCIASACFPDLAATACTGVTCPANNSCDPQDGTCYRSNATCQTDPDCRTGMTCNFLHLCSGCSVDGDCRPAQRCFVGTCLPGN